MPWGGPFVATRACYQITEGPLVEVIKNGKSLRIKGPGTADNGDELLPEGDTGFWLEKFGLWVGFLRDAAGKTTSLVGYQNGSFEGKKVD